MSYDTSDISAAAEAELVRERREEFELSYHGEQDQRRREDEDLRFQVPEMQWDEASAASRMGRTEPGGVVILPRPMLSISKVDQPVRLIMSRAQGAKLGVNIHPVSRDAEQETAETLQDLYRRIERDSNANVARMWALDRAVKAGRGVYRVVVRPDEDGFSYGDLEVGIERILYQGCVYFDPSAQLPDYSDGDHACVTEWMLLDKAKRKYPNARRISEASSAGLAWGQMKADAPSWAREIQGVGKSVQIAECYYKRHRDIVLLILDNGKVVIDGKGKIPKNRKVIAERVRDDVQVWQCVTDGFNLLTKPMRWFGKYIPLIPVLGRELQPFDEQRRIIGIIRNARDPQRFFNTSASTLMERMFLEPRSPWLGPEGFDKGREAEWARANYQNIPVLHYALVKGEDGQLAPPPQRTPIEQTGMSIALLALQEANVLCQDATAFFDPSLGKQTKGKDESGRHALALQGQGDEANSDWLENLAVAMRYEGLCIVDLVAPSDRERIGVYDAPGRITTVLAAETNKPRKIMLNSPFVTDERTGMPRAARKGDQGATLYDMRSGARYGISIEIGTSYKTRLQQADESTTRLIEADPTLMTIFGDILFRNKDFPGKDEMADRMMKIIRGQHPEFFDKDDGSQDPAAKAQALQAQVQQLSQQLHEAVQALNTDKAKYEAQYGAQVQIEQFKAQASQAIAQGKAQLELEITREKNAAIIAVAEINIRGKGVISENESAMELAATHLKVAAETAATAVEQAHERRMQAHDHAHEVGMGAMGAVHAHGQAEQAAGHAADQQARDQAAAAQSQSSAQAHEAEQAANAQTDKAGG